MKYHRWGDFLTKGVKQAVRKWNRSFPAADENERAILCVGSTEDAALHFSAPATPIHLTEETFSVLETFDSQEKFWQNTEHSNTVTSYGILCAVLSKVQYIINPYHSTVLILFSSKAPGFFLPNKIRQMGYKGEGNRSISECHYRRFC